MFFLAYPFSMSSFHFFACSYGLTNYIDTEAKCRHLKTFTCKEILTQVLICLRPRSPYHPLTHCIRVYTVYLFTRGRAGRGGNLNQRRRCEGKTVHKLGRKYLHDRLYYINSDKHMPQSLFTGQYFLRWRHFALPSMSLIFLRMPAIHKCF